MKFKDLFKILSRINNVLKSSFKYIQSEHLGEFINVWNNGLFQDKIC